MNSYEHKIKKEKIGLWINISLLQSNVKHLSSAVISDQYSSAVNLLQITYYIAT